MSVLVVVPARFASTRYPGKPLVGLTGATGVSKSLIQRSWEAAQLVDTVARVVVATDDMRIKNAAEGFGAEVVMTSSDCANGTERCADALERIGGGYDIVVNLQGDAPLTPHWFIRDLVQALEADTAAQMATPVLQCDGAALHGLLNDRKHGRVGGTTVVFNGENHALYFSKEVIPYSGEIYTDTQLTPVYHHVGVYAYRPDALTGYRNLKPGPLEGLEGLEQLRFLENACTVLCVKVDARGRQFWELNNPEDVPLLEKMMADMGMA